MSTVFVDTSALAKRYLIEIGSDWIQRQVRKTTGNTVIIPELTMIEISSLLARHRREQAITVTTESRLRRTFARHLGTQYTVINFDNQVQRIAKRLTIKHPIRTLDAIQLASALQAERLLKSKSSL
ncbi:MAG TPA: type II toxin-antitoxin system VapC family toxin [Phototrophicaceae bacterium]|nr:type II toxin-antitoxin system VapC family toxin [Phototrophicaceae bacterium]